VVLAGLPGAPYSDEEWWAAPGAEGLVVEDYRPRRWVPEALGVGFLVTWWLAHRVRKVELPSRDSRSAHEFRVMRLACRSPCAT